MITGAIISIPLDFDIKKFYEIIWERSEDDYDLKSFIQFESQFFTETGIRGEAALAIHQELKSIPAWKEVSGRYYSSSNNEINHKFAPIFIIPGLIVVNTLSNRRFVKKFINEGLKDTNFALEIALDTPRIALDHPDNWKYGFTGRVGNVDSAILYGDKVEKDIMLKPELSRTTTGIIGWYTQYFGGNIKVYATPRGSVQVWGAPEIPQFIGFLITEILPYRVTQFRQTNISSLL